MKDEIADPQRHAGARMCDGLELAEERLELTLDELVNRLQGLDFVSVGKRSSRFRGAELTLLRAAYKCGSVYVSPFHRWSLVVDAWVTYVSPFGMARRPVV